MKQSPVSVFLSLSYLFAFFASVPDFTLSQPHNRNKTPAASELTAVSQTDSLRHSRVITASSRVLAETTTPEFRSSTPTWTLTSDSGPSPSGWRRETGVENRFTTADRTPRSSLEVWSVGSTPEHNTYSTSSRNAQARTNRNQEDDDRLTEPSTVYSKSAGTPINEHRPNSDSYSSSTDAPSKRPNTSIHRGTESQTDVSTNAPTVTQTSSQEVWRAGSTPEHDTYSTTSGNAQARRSRNQAVDDRLTEPNTVYSKSAGTPINEHGPNSDGYSSSTDAPSKRPNTSIHRGTESQTDVSTNGPTVTQTSSQEVWRAGSTPEHDTYSTTSGNAQARRSRNQAVDDRLTEPNTVYSKSTGTTINEHGPNSDGYSSSTDAPSKRPNTSIHRGTESQTDVSTNAPTVTQASSPGGSTTDSGLITSGAVTHRNQSACQSEEVETLSSPRSAKLGCLIILWVLSMTASVFFGLTVFLWVRLSFLRSRKRPRQSQCGSGECDVGVLWTQPRASIEERVEIWYANGSSSSPQSREGMRRKDRDHERQKRRQAGEIWERPRITPEDLQEFWADKGRMRWNKQCDEL